MSDRKWEWEERRGEVCLLNAVEEKRMHNEGRRWKTKSNEKDV
jgi:hypothetical protein